MNINIICKKEEEEKKEPAAAITWMHQLLNFQFYCRGHYIQTQS